jgi:hypothetical protein
MNGTYQTGHEPSFMAGFEVKSNEDATMDGNCLWTLNDQRAGSMICHLGWKAGLLHGSGAKAILAQPSYNQNHDVLGQRVQRVGRHDHRLEWIGGSRRLRQSNQGIILLIVFTPCVWPLLACEDWLCKSISSGHLPSAFPLVIFISIVVKTLHPKSSLHQPICRSAQPPSALYRTTILRFNP